MSRRVSVALIVGLTAVLFVLVGSGFTAGASTTSGTSSAFSRSEMIGRVFDNDGVTDVVDKPSKFTVNVSQTSNLFGRQEIQV